MVREYICPECREVIEDGVRCERINICPNTDSQELIRDFLYRREIVLDKIRVNEVNIYG